MLSLNAGKAQRTRFVRLVLLSCIPATFISCMREKPMRIIDSDRIVSHSATLCGVRDAVFMQQHRGTLCSETPADSAAKFESLLLTAFAGEPACSNVTVIS